MLITIDENKAEVPNSKENRETFGYYGNQHTKTRQVQALVRGMCDVLNHFYLDIEVEHISISENELIKRNLMHLTEMEIKQPVLGIFDCDYPSIAVY